MHMMLKVRKRDAETQRTRRALSLCDGCGDGALSYTLPLVVAFIIAKSDEAIMQLPSANVYDPPRLLRRGASE